MCTWKYTIYTIQYIACMVRIQRGARVFFSTDACASEHGRARTQTSTHCTHARVREPTRLHPHTGTWAHATGFSTHKLYIGANR